MPKSNHSRKGVNRPRKPKQLAVRCKFCSRPAGSGHTAGCIGFAMMQARRPILDGLAELALHIADNNASPSMERKQK